MRSNTGIKTRAAILANLALSYICWTLSRSAVLPTEIKNPSRALTVSAIPFLFCYIQLFHSAYMVRASYQRGSQMALGPSFLYQVAYSKDSGSVWYRYNINYNSEQSLTLKSQTIQVFLSWLSSPIAG